MQILFIHGARVKGIDYKFPDILEISSSIGISLIDQGIAICISVSGVLNRKTVIPFTATANPKVENYQTALALIYGEYPRVECWIVEGTTKKKFTEPIFNIVAGKIDSIEFDLAGFANSGEIIIS